MFRPWCSPKQYFETVLQRLQEVSSYYLDDDMAKVIVATLVTAAVSYGAYHFFRTTNKQIHDFNDVAVGDHIKFDRGIYCHHAVIVDVDRTTKEYTIIHFVGDKTSDKPSGIKKETFGFKTEEIILIRYRYGRLSAINTMERANALLTIQERSKPMIYNILLNNCEHVATWCVIGKAKSSQINKLLAPIAPIIHCIGNYQRQY